MARAPRLTPRKRPRQDRSRALVEAILEAAALLIAERGWEAVTSNDIADKAGASIGSFYQYFPSRESVLATLWVDLREETLDRIANALLDASELPMDAVARHLAVAYLSAHHVDPRVLRCLFVEGSKLGAERKVREVDGELEQLLTSFLTSRRTDASVVGTILGAIDGVVRRALLHDEIPLDDPGLESRMSALLRGLIGAP